jgi:flagellar hook-basal body complex protein FliE
MTDPLGLISAGAPAVQALRPAGSAVTPGAPGAAEGPSFKDVLMKNLEEVNQAQQNAARAIEDLGSGRRTDMEGVLAAQQKADLAFQLLLQVRNKMMDAYTEIQQVRV